MILTFDLGTTRLKVAVFSLDGQLQGQVAIRHREYASEDGSRQWQSADDWWEDCILAARKLWEGGIDPRQITGCSLSGRAGAGVFVGQRDQVIVQPWSDTRHVDHLRNVLKGRDRHEVAMYGATLIAKFLWLRDRQPALMEEIRHGLYGKDFILYRLTGEAVTDPSSGPDAGLLYTTDAADAEESGTYGRRGDRTKK
ncbi:MAG: hypothetical protein HUJ31_16335, partial [Pseudomonadales bacterium]|nr:hypothetical protein [Pseudomonadales bacterium]